MTEKRRSDGGGMLNTQTQRGANTQNSRVDSQQTLKKYVGVARQCAGVQVVSSGKWSYSEVTGWVERGRPGGGLFTSAFGLPTRPLREQELVVFAPVTGQSAPHRGVTGATRLP